MSQSQQEANVFIRRPAIAGLVSLLIAGFFGYVLFFLLLDLASTPSDPEYLTMSAAARKATEQQIWAVIENGQYDCDSIHYVWGRSSSSSRSREIRYTEIFVTSTAGDVVMFVTLSGEQTCDEIQDKGLKGYLAQMSQKQQQTLTNEVRLAKYINANTYLELCGYCGPTNSLIGVAMSSVALVGGLTIYPLSLRAHRRWREGQNEWMQEKSSLV